MWIILLLFSFCTAELTSIEKFTGEWLPIVTFPNVVTYPICDRYTITVQKANACTCGNQTADLVTAGKGATDTPARSVTMPTLVVENFDEVAPALELKCKCGDEIKRHAVYRLINDNYYVVYEKHPQNVYTTEEPNDANLLVKTVSTTAELKQTIASIPDLKNRSAGIMCDPDKNYKQ